jgi:uncharacterized protein with HEPN domain
MQRDYRVYFKDIVDVTQNIEEYTQDLNFEGLKNNKLPELKTKILAIF